MHLLEFELGDFRAGVSVAVVPDQDISGFVDLTLSDVPGRNILAIIILIKMSSTCFYHRGLSGINHTNSRTNTDGNPCTASGSLQTSEPASFAKLSPYSRNVDTIVPRKKHA